MKRAAVTAGLAIALAVAATAHAAPRRDRVVSLGMRTAAAPEPPDPAAAVPPGAAIDELPRARPRGGRRDVVAPPRPLSEQVVFRFNLGFGLDGGLPRPDGRTLAGQRLDETTDYERLRVYGFGDAVAGTRGIVAPSLSTYFASQFRFDQDIREASTAIPSVYDGARVDDLQIRSAYAESDGFFSHPWLRPIYLRAGRQFRYGGAVSHFDGVSVGYDRGGVSIALFGGRFVSMWGLDVSSLGEPSVSGLELRFDLHELVGWPVTVSSDALTFLDHDYNELALAYRWSRDVLVRASVRTRDQEAARQSLSLRARISEVTTLSAELDHRSAADPLYDLLLFQRVDGRGDPRSYLDLGPVLPRTLLDLRAGTVLLGNLDVLVRAAAAIEGGEGDGPQSSQSAGYLEGGGALEVRVRRALRVGSSFTARRYNLSDRERGPGDPDAPDPLPADTASAGFRSFYEGGLHLHASAGARRFNAGAELYARALTPHSPYLDAEAEEVDVRSGGRFSVEGWAGQRLRLRAEYDVTFHLLTLAPELEGLKTLRVLMEGSF